MNIKHLLLFAGLAAGLTSCDHLLEFEPGDVILAEDAIQDAEDLQRLLVSNYDVVANLYGGRVQIVNELRGPNFGEPDNSFDFTAVYNRETTFFTGINGGIYTDFYYAIYRSNVVIKNFDIVENLDPAERTRLEAEARLSVPSVTGEPSKCMHVLTGTRRTTATQACPCALHRAKTRCLVRASEMCMPRWWKT